jgi:hypothetical protein
MTVGNLNIEVYNFKLYIMSKMSCCLYISVKSPSQMLPVNLNTLTPSPASLVLSILALKNVSLEPSTIRDPRLNHG